MRRSEGHRETGAGSGARVFALGVLLGVGGLLVIAAPAMTHLPNDVGKEVCAACHEDELSHYSATIYAGVLNETNARTEAMRLGCEISSGPGEYS